MIKVRARPVLYEAFQVAGDKPVTISAGRDCDLSGQSEVVVCNPGDWVVKGLDGRFTVWSPAAFYAAFETSGVEEWVKA